MSNSPSRRPRFRPPRDVKAFWLAPHCGPGTLDADDICGFCGNTYRECARKHSESVEQGVELGRTDEVGSVNEGGCGGSGFWCSGCGRFWAQDSCGESPGGEHRAADGKRLEARDGWWYCVCGKRLFDVEES